MFAQFQYFAISVYKPTNCPDSLFQLSKLLTLYSTLVSIFCFKCVALNNENNNISTWLFLLYFTNKNGMFWIFFFNFVFKLKLFENYFSRPLHNIIICKMGNIFATLSFQNFLMRLKRELDISNMFRIVSQKNTNRLIGIETLGRFYDEVVELFDR